MYNKRARRDGKEDMYLLYPEVCIGCGTVLSYRDRKKGICPSCRKKIHFVSKVTCKICGKEVMTPLMNVCKDCIKSDHSFLEGKSLFVYQGPMKMAMYRFKYSNARYMARFFARVAWEKHKDWLGKNGVQAIVSVPMFLPKKRQRGYNQAEVFGKALGRVSGIPYLSDFVVREKNTVPQKGLTKEKRKENLKNAFKIKGYGVKLNCVLIVDDIYTTGTTMDAVAEVLKEYGIERVLCLTICIGVDA